jgi:hypothetical protein
MTYPGNSHHMNLVRRSETGAEEFHCPQCGRRFVIQWAPSYKQIVLELGDEGAPHTYSMDGLTWLANRIAQESYEEASRLAVFEDYLTKLLGRQDDGEATTHH